MTASEPDLVVLGLGPAGRAAAHRALAAGLRVRVFDPAPGRRWHQTFGMFADDLPPWLPGAAGAGVVAARSRPAVQVHTRHDPRREYLVLDTGALQDRLTLDGAQVRAESAGRGGHGRAFVLDARGPAPSGAPARQTAVGVWLPPGAHEALWMDWRRAPGVDARAPASFLYAVPVSADAMLLEETCLAGAPPLPERELERRLRARLAARGIRAGEVGERVDFTLRSAGRRRGGLWCGVGARGTTAHPATGYSVAGSLGFADRVVAALTGPGRPRNPVTRSDIAAHRLREVGLRALLGMSAPEQRDFFEVFFTLPPGRQRDFLNTASGPAATAAAMSAAFAAAPGAVRRRLLAGAAPPLSPIA